MRIAFSGAHATGKTTLIAEVRHQLARYQAIDEPYHALLQEGHQFGAAPSAEDFEVQLARSIAAMGERQEDSLLFDRCPADYLAYLRALRADANADLRVWMPCTLTALRTLQLVVFVPVERPDRIGGAELPRLRRRVDAVLREIWMEDAWGFGTPALEVTGTVPERARQVLAYLRQQMHGHG